MSALEAVEVVQPALLDLSGDPSDDSGLSSSVLSYLLWEENDRRRSPNTLRRYKVVLRQLSRFADPMTATVEDIDDWWVSMYGNKPASVSNALSAARSFYKWAARFDLRVDDPTRRLVAPKIPMTIPLPIGEADLERVLGPVTEGRPADRRAIALMAYGGLRIMEAAAADWSWVDVEKRIMIVNGKGEKERIVGINAVLLDKLLPVLSGNVVNAGYAATKAGTLEQRINYLMASNGIAATCHSFRKRYASVAYDKTGDIIAVQRALGHASVVTTQRYVATSSSAIHRVAAAVA